MDVTAPWRESRQEIIHFSIKETSLGKPSSEVNFFKLIFFTMPFIPLVSSCVGSVE